MNIQVTAVGMDMTPATKTYATEKAQKIERLIVSGHRDAAVVDMKLIAEPSNTKSTKDKCHITISGIGDGDTIHVETEEPDMHVAIDAAVNKLKEPLRRHEERYRDHIRKDAAEFKQRMNESDPESDLS